jgi:hypothetical protein
MLEEIDIEAKLYVPVGELLEDYDALICPTVNTRGLAAGDGYVGRGIEVGGVDLPFYFDSIPTPVFNILSRCPVLAVPSGFADNGVPTVSTSIFASNAYLKDNPESFPSTYVPYGSPEEVVFRDGQLQIDNGNCHTPRNVLFFGGQEPSRTANCKPNEVDVPDVVGQPVSAATARLNGQPLSPSVQYKIAKPGEKLNVVLGQKPRKGRLSAYDHVTLIVAKPTHGVVPSLVGLPIDSAKRKCARRGLEVDVEETQKGPAGRVIFQLPRAGVAAAPGMHVRLAVRA